MADTPPPSSSPRLRKHCSDGATELDMVINISQARTGNWEYVAAEIRRLTKATHAAGAKIKVIFENAYLDDPAKDSPLRNLRRDRRGLGKDLHRICLQWRNPRRPRPHATPLAARSASEGRWRNPHPRRAARSARSRRHPRRRHPHRRDAQRLPPTPRPARNRRANRHTRRLLTPPRQRRSHLARPRGERVSRRVPAYRSILFCYDRNGGFFGGKAAAPLRGSLATKYCGRRSGRSSRSIPSPGTSPPVGRANRQSAAPRSCGCVPASLPRRRANSGTAPPARPARPSCSFSRPSAASTSWTNTAWSSKLGIDMMRDLGTKELAPQDRRQPPNLAGDFVEVPHDAQRLRAKEQRIGARTLQFLQLTRPAIIRHAEPRLPESDTRGRHCGLPAGSVLQTASGIFRRIVALAMFECFFATSPRGKRNRASMRSHTGQSFVSELTGRNFSVPQPSQYFSSHLMLSI